MNTDPSLRPQPQALQHPAPVTGTPAIPPPQVCTVTVRRGSNGRSKPDPDADCAVSATTSL